MTLALTNEKPDPNSNPVPQMIQTEYLSSMCFMLSHIQRVVLLNSIPVGLTESQTAAVDILSLVHTPRLG